MVNVRIIARADKTRFAHGERRLVHDRRGNKTVNIVKRVHFVVYGRYFLAFKGCEDMLYFGQLFRRLLNGNEVAAVGGAVDDARYEPFKVKHARKRLRKLAALYYSFVKLGNSLLPAVYIMRIFKREIYVFAQKSCARRRARFIEHPKKRALLFLRAHRFGKL